MSVLKTGTTHKAFLVKALAGMEMPEHHSTLEAVIIVQRGKAVLTMPDMKHVLDKGSVFIIPAGVNHTLTALQDFRAIAVMPIASEIEFC